LGLSTWTLTSSGGQRTGSISPSGRGTAPGLARALEDHARRSVLRARTGQRSRHCAPDLLP
jgi:hypothetical protein